MIIKKAIAWFEKGSLPYGALIAVVLVELLLCADYHERRWNTRALLSPERDGEGLVIQWNGLGYYAWLRSLLIDHDWDFDNEFDEHKLQKYYVPPPSYRTPLGRRANQWSVGPACIWAITVVPGHFILTVGNGLFGPWAPDGYSLPYQLLVGATSLLLAFLGLGLIYGICRTQARPTRAALAAALLTLGTTIVYFNAIEISLPHGMGTAVLAGLVWYWLKTYGSLRLRRWFLVGVLVGAAALVRWQLATFAILPLAEAMIAGRRRTRKGVMLAGLAMAGAVLAFIPQLIAWRCVYGSWLVTPIQGVYYHWLTPSLWEIFCSQDRSLFYWTPLTLIACIGALACLRQPKHAAAVTMDSPSASPKQPLWILCLAFGIQVYALTGMWGKGERLPSTGNFAGIFLARSYGFRDMTESLVVLAPGLAWLLEQAPPWRFRFLSVLGLLLVVWNLLLVALYTKGAIPAHVGASPSTLLTRTAALIDNDPLVLLQTIVGPILIGTLLVFADPKQEVADARTLATE